MDIQKIINNVADIRNIDFLFKRGFLLTEDKTDCSSLNFLQWKKINFPNFGFKSNIYTVLYHPANEVYYYERSENFILLLGNILDINSYTYDKTKIASSLLNILLADNIFKFYDYIDTLCGRFVIIYSYNNKIFLINDACGLRSVYYHSEKLLVSSHYNLINIISNNAESNYYKDFYKNLKFSERFWLLPGDITPISNIYCLLPNHELNIINHSIKRFWPRKEIKYFSLNEAVEYISYHIESQMNLISNKSKLMIQLTNGNDSRVSLAASRKYKDDILYYSYVYNDRDEYINDANNSEEIALMFNLNFIKCNGSNLNFKSEMYRDIFSISTINHYHFHIPKNILTFMHYLPKDRIAIRSNLMEIFRHGRYDSYAQIKSPKDLTKVLYDKFYNEYADEIFMDFYSRNQYYQLFKYNLCDIAYWEYFHGLWLSAVLLQDDLTFDTYILFNNRKIMEYGLGVPRFYKSTNIISKEITRLLWNDLLYKIPNTKYKSINFVRDINYALSLDDISLSSGNLKNDNKIVDFHIRNYQTSCEVGFSFFSKNNDFINLQKNIKILKSGFYSICINIVVPYFYPFDKFSSKYLIKVNDVVCYELRLNEFQNKLNNINIIKYLSSEECTILDIALICEDDYFGLGCPGYIIIESITCTPITKSFKNKNKIFIFSTYDKFKKVFQEND